MKIQFKAKQTPIPFKIFLIIGGLSIAIYSIYLCFQECSIDQVFIGLIGLLAFFQGIDPFRLKEPYLLINDIRIEYKIRKFGQAWIVNFDEIDFYEFDNNRLRFFFNLTNSKRKTLFLSLFPKELHPEIINTINRILSDKRI
jgi:hypothetical protein